MIQLHEICVMVERNWFLSVCLVASIHTIYGLSNFTLSIDDADNDDGVWPDSITYNYDEELFYVVLNAIRMFVNTS